MAAIFEYRKIEKNQRNKDKHRFRDSDIILTNLPPEQYGNLSSGQSVRLKVKDDRGDTWLTIEKVGSDIWFTGLKKFTKDMKDGDTISLYKEDDDGGPAQYRIEVKN